MKFLSSVLATIVGLFVFFMLSFFLLLFLGAVFGGNNKSINVSENSVLKLDIEQVTNDYAGKFNFEDLGYFEANHDGLINIIEAIEHAKTDQNIKGISIINPTFNLGIAQTKALRDALLDFKKSGKFIMAYANGFSQKEYYVSSVANKIFVNPIGEIDFKGLSTEIMYFKDFQDQSGLKMEVIRHGKYKSAVEPFLTNQMSSENKEQISTFLNSIWSSIVSEISISRNISVTQLNNTATNLLARNPKMALEQKIIDQIAYEDQYHDAIKKLLKTPLTEDYNQVEIIDYANEIATTTKNFSTKEKIAIVYAQGEIGAGEGDLNMVGEISMNRSLKEAREDKNVKAIVLRVDSPGGSALTSELIWREIELTKKVKPVIVSMGNLAASGGYYIACGANRIFAEKSTITGSIGVFGTLPNVSQVTKKYGINTQEVETHQNASGYSIFKPLEENYKNFAQESVENIYTTFVKRVAAGRKMSFTQVDAIAQGRVWSGADALKLKLIDEIGGLNNAVAYAAKMVKIKEFGTKSYPQFEKDFKDWFRNNGLPFAGLKTSEELIKHEIGEENYKIIDKIRAMNRKKGIQAQMPYNIEID